MFICAIIATSFFVLLDYFENNGKNYFWICYFFVVFIYVIVLISANLLNERNIKKFYNLLQDEKFLLDASYHYENQIICIDLKNKKIAFSEIAKNYIFDFADFKGGILETLEKGNKLKVYYYVSLKLSKDDFKLFHITLFNKSFYCQEFTTLKALAKENELLQKFLQFKEKLDSITKYNQLNNLTS